MAKRTVAFVRVPRLPKAKRFDVSRAEFDRVIERLNERAVIIERLQRDAEIQFRRTAQLQAEVDRLKQTITRQHF